MFTLRQTNEPVQLVKGQMRCGFLFATVILWSLKVIRLQCLGHMECSVAVFNRRLDHLLL